MRRRRRRNPAWGKPGWATTILAVLGGLGVLSSVAAIAIFGFAASKLKGALPGSNGRLRLKAPAKLGDPAFDLEDFPAWRREP